MNAQIKLLDMWKASNTLNHPMKLKRIQATAERATTRAITNGNLVESGITILAKNTFMNDSIKAWNNAPLMIKACQTVWAAKKEIRKFVKTLPG